MDIISLLKNFISEGGVQKILPVVNFLRENSFDLKKAMNSLTPETLATIFRSETPQSAYTPPAKSAFANGVAPIANVADSEIVYALNRYVSAES